MKSISHYGKTTNIFPLAIPVATSTDVLTVPVKGDKLSLTLKHVGIDANVKIKLYWSNDGLTRNVLNDTTGTAVEIAWTITDTNVGINLVDIDFAYLHIVVDKLAATMGNIVEAQINGCSDTPSHAPVIDEINEMLITNQGFTPYASVDPQYPARVTFEYGVAAPAYGSETAITTIYEKDGVATAVTGLLANTDYHWRVKVVTVAGTFYSADQTFKTLA